LNKHSADGRIPNRELREDVVNAMAKVAYDAIKAGAKGTAPYAIVGELFPGTPDMVIIDAVTRAEMQCDEEWWQMVEDTIDGEVVKKAVALVHQKAAKAP